MTLTNMQTPTTGQIVHYVAYGTPGGEYPSVCRAAVVTETGHITDHPLHPSTVGLAVLNPTGMFFNRQVAHHPGDPAVDAPGARCNSGDRAYPGGTWHWPELA